MRRREIYTGKDNLRVGRLELGKFNDDGLPVDGLIEDQIHHPSLLSDESLSQRTAIQLYNPSSGTDIIMNAKEVDVLGQIVDERESMIVDMIEHVNEWKVQREYVIKCKNESVLDLNNGVQWPDRRDCFVGDYCQNMGLPHFGNEQPGETYYYSPLGIYIFGIVNYSTE